MQQHLLIVDDEDSIVFALREYFLDSGFKVDCAGDLAHARALLASTSYSAAIVDLSLGGSDNCDGLEVIEMACRQDVRPRIVLLTAHGSREFVIHAMRRGADFVLQKPVPLAQLRDALSGSAQGSPVCVGADTAH